MNQSPNQDGQIAPRSSQDACHRSQADNMNNVSSSNDQRQDQNHLNELRKGFKYKYAYPLDNFSLTLTQNFSI